MKLDDWGKLLISWANFLEPSRNITKIEELATSGLFPHLIKVLKCSEEISNAEDYCIYLQEQYVSLDFGSQKNREATVLEATAFLIYCSLHHPNNGLQQKMMDLPHLIQCQLTDFLQEFVDVPKSKITKEMIFSKISEMRNIGVTEGNTVRTPPNFGTPVTYTSSPSTEEIMSSKTNSSTKKTSRLKKLRRDIETLTSLKVELIDELDSAKEFIAKLESDMKKKDAEISKLKLELKKTEGEEHICEKQKADDNFKAEKLKATIENLEQEKCELEVKIIDLTNEKEGINKELKKSKSIVQKAEVQRKLSDDIRAEMEEEITNLKNAIEQLMVTNNEQSEYINELTRGKDDSKSFSDSQSENVFLPESLGQHVIDLQVRELQSDLEMKETEIYELKNTINSLNISLDEKIKIIEEHTNLLENKESDLKQKTFQIKCLEGSVLKLTNELEASQDSYKKIVLESECEINKIKEKLEVSHEMIVVFEGEKEKLEKKINSYVETIQFNEEKIQNLNETIEQSHREITSLRKIVEEVQERLDNTIKSNKEKTIIKNEQIKLLEDSVSAWVGRNMELNNLLENLTSEIEEKDLTIKNNETDLRNLECQNLFLTNALQEKDSIINSMQASINSMNEDLTSLKHKESSLTTELKTSESRISLFQTQASDLNDLLNNCLSEKNSILKALEDKETTIQQQINKLKDMKTDFEARKRKLESDLEQKEKEYKEAEEDRCRLNIDLDDLKHKFLFLEIKMKEKEKETFDDHCLIEKLEADLKLINKKEIELTDQIKEYEKNIIKYEQELDSSKNAVSELQKEISQLLLEAEEHNKVEFSLKNQIFTNTEIISDLKTKLTLAETKKKEMHEQFKNDKESMNSVIEELKLLLVKLNEDLSVNNEINDLLTKDLNERNETIKNLENSMKTLQSELLFLKEENLNFINDVSSKCIALEELNKNYESCKSEINSLIIEKVEMSQELDKCMEKYNAEVQKTENLQNKISEYVLKVNTLADELISKDGLIFNLKKDLDELKCLKIDMDDVREAAQNEISSLNEEVASLEANKLSLEKLLKDKEEYLNSLQVTLHRKDDLLDSLEESNRSLRENLELAHSDNAKLESEIDDLKKEIMESKSTFEILKQECENKTRQVNDYSQKLEDFMNKSHLEIKNIEENYVMEKSKLTKEINNLMIEFKSLKEEKEKLNIEFKNIKMDHSVCSNKIISSENLIKELKEKENTLNNRVLKYQENEETLKKDMDDKSAATDKLYNDIGCLKKLISTYEFEEGILNTKLKAKETEIVKLKSTINDLSTQLRNNEVKFEEELKFKAQKIHDLDSTIGKLNSQYIQVSKEKESLLLELENKKTLELDLKSLETDYKLLKEEIGVLERKSIMKNEELSQFKLNISSYETEIQCLKIENENKNKTLQDKIKELEETKSAVKALQNETLESKMKEKVVMEQLVLHNEKIFGMEQKLDLSETKLKKAELEISYLKDSIQKKDELIESFAKEKNCSKLDMDILSKKNEMVISHLDAKKNEIKELSNKLSKAESEISKCTLKNTEQEKAIESLYSTLHSQNIEINEKNNEIDILQKEIKKVIQQLSEERSNNISLFEKLKADKEVHEAKLKSHISEADFKDHIEEIRSTYEKKVHTLKAVMKKQFTEKLEDLTYSIQNENTDLKEKLFKEQEKCARLQSELWNASDKLLIAQEQNRTLLSNLQSRNAYEVFRPSEPLSPISKARSMEVLSGRNRGIDNFARDISFNESGSSRRSSIRSLPRGMGKKFSFSAGRVFPAAEEDGEVFDNRYLADLKAGRCDVQYDPDRMSILQYRNSLCPPHLKSSYPAETQFINTVKEDDIKVGTCPSTGNSESDVRKIKVQSSYKKPGPPTPSKNGGRLSQGNEKPCPSSPRSGQSTYNLPKDQNEKFILRESNKRETLSKALKPSTPSRLKALFTHKKDENSPRRKSFFRRS